MTPAVVALDVGGTSVKSALVDPALHQVREIHDDPVDSLGATEVLLAALVAILRRAIDAASAAEVVGIGVGFPGPFDFVRGISLVQPGSAEARAISHAGGHAKYESLYGLDLRAGFRAGLGRPDLPIAFANDATVALMGEARYGAGRPYRRLIGLTLGTGLGSAFVVEGMCVVDGVGVPPHGWLYSEPYRGAAADDSFSTRGLRRRWQQAGGDFIDAKAAAEAARAGAPLARQAFETFGAELGAFVQPYARQFGAEALLILGGLAGAFDLFEQPLAGVLGLPVHRSTLGPQAPLLGAADLLMQSLPDL